MESKDCPQISGFIPGSLTVWGSIEGGRPPLKGGRPPSHCLKERLHRYFGLAKSILL